MNHRKKAVLVIAIVCIILSISAAIASKYGIFFLVEDTFSRLFSPVEFDSCQIDTEEYQIEALLADPRITFDQSGMLVNMQYKLAEDFKAEICQYKDTGVLMNQAMVDAYAQMSAQVNAQFGQTLYIRSSYRTAEEQAETILEEGEKAIAVGASEHQTGLALDVYVKSYAGKGFLKSPVGQWVNKECWKYGFIIRYPYYKQNVDGIGYEPWHIRYIGKPHAEIMYRQSLTLEEYFGILADGQWRQFGDYYISRQTGDKICLPPAFISATVSVDHTGGYLVTVLT